MKAVRHSVVGPRRVVFGLLVSFCLLHLSSRAQATPTAGDDVRIQRRLP
ncbi:MAG TPA: hypothetical protein VFU71_13390 [Burkholderiaceae bacterium]|nr:hypothetical protein [Burkholderiaceae bacterium]